MGEHYPCRNAPLNRYTALKYTNGTLWFGTWLPKTAPPGSTCSCFERKSLFCRHTHASIKLQTCKFYKIHSLPSRPSFYGIRRDSDTAVSPLSSCPTLSLSLFLLSHLKLSFHSALCPDSDINPPLSLPAPAPSRPPMSWSEICRSKNIHPLYPNNRIKKKNPVLGPGAAVSYSLGPFLGFLRTEKVWGCCPILPGHGMHVISLVRMSLMPFSLDPADFPSPLFAKCSALSACCFRDECLSDAQITPQSTFTFVFQTNSDFHKRHNDALV